MDLIATYESDSEYENTSSFYTTNYYPLLYILSLSTRPMSSGEILSELKLKNLFLVIDENTTTDTTYLTSNGCIYVTAPGSENYSGRISSQLLKMSTNKRLIDRVDSGSSMRRTMVHYKINKRGLRLLAKAPKRITIPKRIPSWKKNKNIQNVQQQPVVSDVVIEPAEPMIVEPIAPQTNSIVREISHIAETKVTEDGRTLYLVHWKPSWTELE